MLPQIIVSPNRIVSDAAVISGDQVLLALSRSREKYDCHLDIFRCGNPKETLI